MLNSSSFRNHAHQLVDWMADYLESVEQYPVKSQAQPGDLLAQLPQAAPIDSESMEQILADFERLIMPGITHWQSPNFFAYFPANASYPSLLAEMLTATVGAQCMIWDTSPAAAELEERMMQWLGQLIGLPTDWEGSIQSTASDATLCALLSAREQASKDQINARGFTGQEGYRVYASSQTHSSIEKGVKIAGLGRENLVQVAVDEAYTLDPEALRRAIETDMQAGLQPLCVVATLGTTSSTAIDPLGPIAEICLEFGVWLHVDAAFAGSALILPEYQHWLAGIEAADSFVFNPHKWLFTNFDCSAYFVKDAARLVQTFEIMPEYLKTQADRQVNNYRDWGIPLGRRFRALKLWFVLRSYGQQGLQEALRQHISWAQELAAQVDAHADFERMAPTPINLVCFRACPQALPEAQWNDFNAALLARLNASGKLYLTHTLLDGRYTLRLVIGQTRVQRAHVQAAWERIQAETRALLAANLTK